MKGFRTARAGQLPKGWTGHLTGHNEPLLGNRWFGFRKRNKGPTDCSCSSLAGRKASASSQTRAHVHTCNQAKGRVTHVSRLSHTDLTAVQTQASAFRNITGRIGVSTVMNHRFAGDKSEAKRSEAWLLFQDIRLPAGE
jgi:hypothetical protein